MERVSFPMQDYSVSGLIPFVAAHPAFRELLGEARTAGPVHAVGPLGLPSAARPVVVAALAEGLGAPLLWLTPQPDEARTLAETLRAFVSDPRRVHLLPAPDAMPYERIPWDPVTRERRLAALAALHAHASGDSSAPPPIIVASVRGLMVRTVSPDLFGAESRLCRVGDTVSVTGLSRQLVRLGYEPATAVTQPGQFAHRGGILDVYPPADSKPTRIEWFGDEIDSMREFNPTSQRSERSKSEVLVIPAAEALPERGPEVADEVARLQLGRMHPIAESEVRGQLERLRSGERFGGLEFYGPLLHPEGATALDYLPQGSWLVTSDVDQLRAAADGVTEQAATVRSEQVDAGELPGDWPGQPLVDWEELARRAAGMRHLALGASIHGGPGLGATGDSDGRAIGAAPGADGASHAMPEPSLELAESFGSPPPYGGRVEEAVLDAANSSERGDAVVVVTRQAPRFAELLSDAGVDVAPQTSLRAAPGPGGLALVHGALGRGWTMTHDGVRMVVITDGEIFGWRMPHRRRQAQRSSAAERTDFFSELAPDTYVVHIEHGIGLFRGLTRMRSGAAEREYLQIEYAQGDMLYVPTHQADRVARYVGVGEVDPSVSRLGTADWERAKKRARRAVEDIARELLEFYAKREVARRTPFASDTPWQAEMEAAFPYLETDDQLRAIEEVKRDMESDRPMDRLVVGDVGFGKTEVALRAAFKAVMGGKQVAVLAPTTVLAQQHYDTFKRRLSPFPVRIEMLSRFKNRAQQATIIDRLATREVDVVIGTHRLLSQDVQFHDLGLLIIDEEHRFGVKHKERLRQLREDVDTLTLTATPIPRTMHMALSGLRDLTMIDTPPDERLPVVTHVGPTDDNLVRQAIRRELGRRGQVFYVFNRVQGIEMIAQKVRKLVPEARIGVAHGQMHEGELAKAMLDFVGGAVDVLVCTSIIESGLDIQNANTLIVERADRFGLAQLHQLRGRVGRSAQRAYAYLLYPPGHELPDDAKQRLDALADASTLGSGFRLALRDLEIRGAGEILGARQHGQVTAIGLDLYTRLLAEAIKKLQADQPVVSDSVSRELESIDPGTLPTVDLPLDAHLPEDYIAETSERTRLYRRMAAIDALDDVVDLERELADRFGAPPAPVSNLLVVLRLRVLAHLAGARSIGSDGHRAVVWWPDDHDLSRGALMSALPPDSRVGRHQLSLALDGAPSEWLSTLRGALEAAARVESRAGGR
ncbi:MAG: transcription-repair coupling factor [Anaerolineae bacterium]